MNRPPPNVLSALSILPLLSAIVLFLGTIAISAVSMSAPASSASWALPAIYALWVTCGIGFLLGFGMAIFSVIHAVREAEFEEIERVVWIVLLLVVPVLSLPAYWYLYLSEAST